MGAVAHFEVAPFVSSPHLIAIGIRTPQHTIDLRSTDALTTFLSPPRYDACTGKQAPLKQRLVSTCEELACCALLAVAGCQGCGSSVTITPWPLCTSSCGGYCSARKIQDLRQDYRRAQQADCPCVPLRVCAPRHLWGPLFAPTSAATWEPLCRESFSAAIRLEIWEDPGSAWNSVLTDWTAPLPEAARTYVVNHGALEFCGNYLCPWSL